MDSTDAIEIEIDLRDTRAEAERSGALPAHAVHGSELSQDIKSLVASEPDSLDSVVTVVPMSGAEPAAKDMPQIIDAIGVVLAPIGVAGLVKLIMAIVKACRKTEPTVIELKIGEREFRMIGPDVKPDDLRKWQRALEETPRTEPGTPHSRRAKVKIKPLARDR